MMISQRRKNRMFLHLLASGLSQIVHGEQGALLVVPVVRGKLITLSYMPPQTFDEARHVEVFNKYLQERIGWNYPVMPGLKALLDKILSDPRWDLKFIGMQIIIEGLALAALKTKSCSYGPSA